MGTVRKVNSGALVPAAWRLRDVAEQLDGAAEDIAGAGRTASAGAGQFAGELAEGAAVLSLAWTAASRQAGLSAVTIAAVAEQAVAVAERLDVYTAAALSGTARPW